MYEIDPPREKFYVTSPIYYINDRPHIGHAYSTIAADALARYHRMRGARVYYVTGTDENSQKNVDAAHKAGTRDLTAYLDDMSDVWRETWRELNISHDDFIRTTESRHVAAVNQFWASVQERGDIYKGTYTGWYCVACEAFYPRQELVGDGTGTLCPIHKKNVTRIEEENYFFKLTYYREALLEYITLHPDFIQPVARTHEIVNYIKDHMTDVSISRHKGTCGIEVPGDPDHKIYVWFDALINYLSAVGYGTQGQKCNAWWPADLHVVGKDIIKFHCALWPAMLMSAGLPLPHRVFAHGFFTIDGAKMSKTTGNAVSPLEITKEYGVDPLRYYLLSEITFGEDGDFSFERMRKKYVNELSNELGNLVYRILSMTEKYNDGKIGMSNDVSLSPPWRDYVAAMERCELHAALQSTWKFVRVCNKMIDDKKPWALYVIDPAGARHFLTALCEGLRHIALMLTPFMPHIAQSLLTQLGLDPAKEYARIFENAIAWGGIAPGTVIRKGTPLFPRLDS